ncbi:hypothetical protein Hanom_Chr07g00639941 [Helianthus anomalus]
MFNASEIAQARLSSFQIYTKSVEKKNGGDANVKYAWFRERWWFRSAGFDDLDFLDCPR